MTQRATCAINPTAKDRFAMFTFSPSKRGIFSSEPDFHRALSMKGAIACTRHVSLTWERLSSRISRSTSAGLLQSLFFPLRRDVATSMRTLDSKTKRPHFVATKEVIQP